jgi:hypothetical protein
MPLHPVPPLPLSVCDVAGTSTKLISRSFALVVVRLPVVGADDEPLSVAALPSSVAVAGIPLNSAAPPTCTAVAEKLQVTCVVPECATTLGAYQMLMSRDGL